MRINVIIDDQLMNTALKTSGLKTKKDALAAGLKLIIQFSGQKAIREYRSKLKWHGDLNKMRLDS